MKHLLFVALQFSTVAFGQTSYATFSADTTRIHHERSRMTVFEKIMESEWQINGQTLTYGSTPIRVETDNQVDTIFFRQDKNARWDTLICSISRPTNYTFYYNECCGGFNTADETGTYLVGSVQFENRNPKKGKHYLGTLGEAGVIIDKNSVHLKPTCRSAMSPNCYEVTLREIEPCSTTDSCNEEICLVEPNSENPNYGFGYATQSTLFRFLFLPLSNDPIHVSYNTKSGTVQIK